MKTLLPCPFCGGAPRKFNCVESDGFVSGTFVRCDECGIDINDEYESGAVEAWNRRASPPAPAAEPVAYRFKVPAAGWADTSGEGWTWSYGPWPCLHSKNAEPLYTHPLDAATVRAEARREALRQVLAAIDEHIAGEVELKKAARWAGDHEDARMHGTCGGAMLEIRAVVAALADKGEA